MANVRVAINKCSTDLNPIDRTMWCIDDLSTEYLSTVPRASPMDLPRCSCPTFQAHLTIVSYVTTRQQRITDACFINKLLS